MTEYLSELLGLSDFATRLVVICTMFVGCLVWTVVKKLVE